MVVQGRLLIGQVEDELLAVALGGSAVRAVAVANVASGPSSGNPAPEVRHVPAELRNESRWPLLPLMPTARASDARAKVKPASEKAFAAIAMPVDLRLFIPRYPWGRPSHFRRRVNILRQFALPNTSAVVKFGISRQCEGNGCADVVSFYRCSASSGAGVSRRAGRHHAMIPARPWQSPAGKEGK